MGGVEGGSGHLGIYILFNLHDHTTIIIISVDVERGRSRGLRVFSSPFFSTPFLIAKTSFSVF